MKTLSVSAEPDFPLSAYGSEKVAAPQGDLCQEKYTFPDSDFFSHFGYLRLSFGREKSLQAVLRALFVLFGMRQEIYTFSDTFGQTSH